MADFLRCKDCKHNKGKCVGVSRRASHKNCFEPKVMTNADRIRAMSDEELTDAWIRDNTICHRCAYWGECEFDEFVTNEKCREGILEWHKQPADMRGEEDGN